MKKTLSILLSLIMTVTAVAVPLAVNAEEHHHDFGTGELAEYEVSWDQNNVCTCKGVCKGCGQTVTETVEGVPSVYKEPTCTKWGETKYTATFKDGFDEEFEILEDIEPLKHDFGKGELAEYEVNWSADNICTCKGVCKRCGKTVKEKITPKKKTVKKATCTKWGSTKYIAKSELGFDTETEIIEDIKPLGHSLDKKTKKCKRCNAKGKKNTLVAKGKTVKAKAKKAQSFSRKKAISVKKAKGKVTFAKVKGNAKIAVAKNGKIKIKKGLKKGKYKVVVKVKAAGKGLYLPKTKKVTVKIVVK